MVKSISEEEQMLAAGYVLGDLDTLETTEFESALATNPALQAEVSALQIAFDRVPQGLPQVAPPPALKAKILNDFVATASITNPTVNLPQPTVIAASPAPSNRFTWGRLFAGVGLLIGGLLAFDNFKLRQQLQFAQQVNPQELASILTQPKSRLLTLSTQSDRVVGKVLFTPGNWQQVIVSAKNLPPLPVDRVYRMWLELANGQVIPCGEFKTDDRNSIFIKLNAQQNPPAGVKAKGVFVTIDRSNDPLQPTGQRVIQGTI
jgi:Anti-sigma-K factor rskA